MQFKYLAILSSFCLPWALASTPPSQTDATFINTVLTRTNDYRSKHGANALTWDATLANAARTAANKCNALHTANNPYGENWASFYYNPKTYAVTPAGFATQAQGAIDTQYNEKSQYSVNSYMSSLHFTQIVWKSSTKMGCAWSATQCSDTNGKYYLYCEFYPRGNVQGQFATNVTP